MSEETKVELPNDSEEAVAAEETVEEVELADGTEATIESVSFERDEEPLADAREMRDADAERAVELQEEHDVDDAMIDAQADCAIELLEQILPHFDIHDYTIGEYEGDEGELILDITGPDLAVLIGRHGRTLDALQYLVTTLVYRKLGFRHPLVIDVEGYKGRQREKIEGLAKSAAARAVSQGRDIPLRPMNPYERRIVHMYLRDDDKVETSSEGEGSDRHVVVRLR